MKKTQRTDNQEKKNKSNTDIYIYIYITKQTQCNNKHSLTLTRTPPTRSPTITNTTIKKITNRTKKLQIESKQLQVDFPITRKAQLRHICTFFYF